MYSHGAGPTLMGRVHASRKATGIAGRVAARRLPTRLAAPCRRSRPKAPQQARQLQSSWRTRRSSSSGAACTSRSRACSARRPRTSSWAPACLCALPPRPKVSPSSCVCPLAVLALSGAGRSWLCACLHHHPSQRVGPQQAGTQTSIRVLFHVPPGQEPEEEDDDDAVTACDVPGGFARGGMTYRPGDYVYLAPDTFDALEDADGPQPEVHACPTCVRCFATRVAPERQTRPGDVAAWSGGLLLLRSCCRACPSPGRCRGRLCLL